MGISARTFSELIGEKSSNTQNYVGARNSTPGADYLEKVLRHFETVNPAWLLLGEGEPFKEGTPPTQTQTNISGKKNTIAVAGTNNGTATTNNYNLADCEKERDTYKAQLDIAQNENKSLRDQLARADKLAASQQDMLDFLRGGLNRPN